MISNLFIDLPINVRNTFKDLGEVPMTEIHRKELRSATYNLTKCMQPKSVLCFLCSRGILTNDEKSTIRLNTTTDDQVEQLIDLLLTKSDPAFNTLIEALTETEQWHAVTVIRESGE